LTVEPPFTKPCDNCLENEVCNLLEICECDSNYIREASTENCVGKFVIEWQNCIRYLKDLPTSMRNEFSELIT